MDRLERCSASVAEGVIRLACRRLPASERELRAAEWAAELPAVLSDPDRGSRFRRLLGAVSYTADLFRGVRRIAPHGAVRRWLSEQLEEMDRGWVEAGMDRRFVVRFSAPMLTWIALMMAFVQFDPSGRGWPGIVAVVSGPLMICALFMVAAVELRRLEAAEQGNRG